MNWEEMDVIFVGDALEGEHEIELGESNEEQTGSAGQAQHNSAC